MTTKTEKFFGRLSALQICLVFAIIACVVHLPLNLNHDTSLLMYFGFQVLEGAKIGSDIVEVTPPMSIWFFSIPAAITELLYAPPKIVMKLFVISLIFTASLGLSRMMGQFNFPEKHVNKLMILIGFGAVLLPGYDFAQREHVMVMLTLGYVFSVIFRAQDKSLTLQAGVIVGVLAAIGICFKPYFLALPIIMELWLMARKRKMFIVFRPETIAMLGALVIHVALVYVFASDYLTIIVPNMINSYGAYNVSLDMVLFRIVERLFPFVLWLIILQIIVKGHVNDVQVQGCLVACGGFILSALAQQKGWSYHLYPAVFYAWITIGIQILSPTLETRTSISNRFRRIFEISLGCILGLLIIEPSAYLLKDGHAVNGTSARIHGLEAAIQSKAKNTGEAVSVMAFITSPRDVHPAVLNTRADWQHKSGVLVYLPGALAAQAADVRPENYEQIVQIAEQHDQDMLTSLVQNPPDVFIIDTNPYRLAIEDKDFDYLKYYGQDERFSTMMTSYTEHASVGTFRIFILHAATN